MAMPWEGYQHPPFDEDRFNRLVQAFNAIPNTPDARLKRDIWHRLNALNRKKLDRMERENRRYERILREREMRAERIRARDERAAELRCDPEELPLFVTTHVPISIWWRGKRKQWILFYRKHIIPIINKLFRDLSFLVWLLQIVQFESRGQKFSHQLAVVMP
ncbi:uncharacterized protein PV09_04901 [Verruconis gallopava]|uniref:Uncharacterized protein n=1 Tax=Verruconis gallopava TaxID=253628 RepID=A0A0D2AY66_9PEZI|nr:uncharacterized protein PV09_04901 [Verruconis gallopava]KIW04084.1 hypothetical protein PV09_04901 [Verruconis gallopava]